MNHLETIKRITDKFKYLKILNPELNGYTFFPTIKKEEISGLKKEIGIPFPPVCEYILLNVANGIIWDVERKLPRRDSLNPNE